MKTSPDSGQAAARIIVPHGIMKQIGGLTLDELRLLFVGSIAPMLCKLQSCYDLVPDTPICE